jgi:hypothetical protein
MPVSVVGYFFAALVDGTALYGLSGRRQAALCLFLSPLRSDIVIKVGVSLGATRRRESKIVNYDNSDRYSAR